MGRLAGLGWKRQLRGGRSAARTLGADFSKRRRFVPQPRSTDETGTWQSTELNVVPGWEDVSSHAIKADRTSRTRPVIIPHLPAGVGEVSTTTSCGEPGLLPIMTFATRPDRPTSGCKEGLDHDNQGRVGGGESGTETDHVERGDVRRCRPYRRHRPPLVWRHVAPQIRVRALDRGKAVA